MLLLLPGCLTVGNEFSSQVNWISTGHTTRPELEKKIGQPFRVGYDSGLLTYTYGFYRYSVFRPTRTKDLVIRFKSDGTVESYSFGSSFDEDRARHDRSQQQQDTHTRDHQPIGLPLTVGAKK